MAEERNEDDNGADAAAARAAKKKKFILLGGLIALLLLVAGGGTWFVLHLANGGKPETATPAKQEAQAVAEDKGSPKKAAAIYEPLEPAFLANYLVGGRQHYLQLSLTVMARDKEAIDGVHAHMPLIRNRIVLLLSGETFDGLQTDDGRVQLQQKLVAAIQEILQKETGKAGIEQVFFTNFVMQ